MAVCVSEASSSASSDSHQMAPLPAFGNLEAFKLVGWEPELRKGPPSGPAWGLSLQNRSGLEAKNSLREHSCTLSVFDPQ